MRTFIVKQLTTKHNHSADINVLKQTDPNSKPSVQFIELKAVALKATGLIAKE